MSGFEIVKRAMLKTLLKKGDDGIMLTLPKDEIVDLNARITMDRLIKAGIDPESLTSPDQVLNILDNINNQMLKNTRVLSGDEAAKFLNKAFRKKGEVVQFPQKRSFKEEIEAMKKSGDLVDEKDMVISDKITEREMFKEANEKFNKTDVIADTVAKITSMEPVAALKEANKVIGRKGIYKSLDETQSKKILTDSEDWIFQRDPNDLYDYNKNRPFRDDPDYDPDEPGFYTGGMVDVEPSLSDIGHGSDALMARTRLMSPGSQSTTSTGLNYLLAEDNDNIRVPFGSGGLTPEDYLKVKDMLNHYHKYKKSGKPKISKADFAAEFFRENNADGGRIGFAAGGDAGRRAFLKLMATLGGGIAGIKSGILGLGEGGAKKAVTETVKQSAGSGTPPPYFFKLVEKIKTLGDDVTVGSATMPRTKVTRYKNYELTEDVVTGSKEIKKMGVEDDMITKNEYMTYTKGQADETTKGKKPADEYEEVTESNSRIIKDEFNDPDYADGIELKEILEEVGETVTKKADGGRIGFSPGGLANVLARLGIKGSSRRFLEKAFGKEKFANMIENDPELHRGLLEVVEMFRNRDKEGLKMYMQKFLPHMDDVEIEQFIVGTTPDIEGLTGQLTRLGSGRDYAGKLEMMKKADQVKKLQNFDIKNVTKNAEGGRIELKGGGDALKAILKYFAKQSGKKGSDQLKDINPKALGSGIANIMGPEHLKMLKNNQTEYLESLLNIMKSDKKFLNNLKANTDEAIAQAPIGMEDYAKEITESIKQNAMKGSRFDRMKVYDKIDIDDAIVDVEQMIKNRRVKESDGRALNALGGLQTMLGE